MPKRDSESLKQSGKQLTITWQTKICIKCKINKPLNYFSKLTRSKDGLDRNCKKCNNERNKNVYLGRKDKVKEYGKKYYQENKEERRLREKNYREKYPERYQLRNEIYYSKNKKHVLEYGKEYYQKNKDRINKRSAERYEPIIKPRNQIDRLRQNKVRREYRSKRIKTDPEYKLSFTLRGRIHTALRRADATKSCKSFELLGCTIPVYKEYLSNLFKPGMNWENHGEWHIDHIKPCASFDLTDPKQQKECFNYTNTQPLWALDNYKKSAKHTGVNY